MDFPAYKITRVSVKIVYIDGQPKYVGENKAVEFIEREGALFAVLGRDEAGSEYQLWYSGNEFFVNYSPQ